MIERHLVEFHDGPKAKEQIAISFSAGLGMPDTIHIVCYDPEQETMREGAYHRSPLAERLYLWDGWLSDPHPANN